MSWAKREDLHKGLLITLGLGRWHTDGSDCDEGRRYFGEPLTWHDMSPVGYGSFLGRHSHYGEQSRSVKRKHGVPMSEIPRERIIEDVSTLKALADPVRMTLLDLTMAQPERTWTARELAGIVGVLPTNIYYHLNLLERNELLQVRDTRVVNGIIEKHYGAGQRAIVYQRGVGEGHPAQFERVAAVFDRLQDDLELGLRKGTMQMSRSAPDAERAVVSCAFVQIPEDQIAGFREELIALVGRYEGTGVPGVKFTVVAAMHPSDI